MGNFIKITKYLVKFFEIYLKIINNKYKQIFEKFEPQKKLTLNFKFTPIEIMTFFNEKNKLVIN